MSDVSIINCLYQLLIILRQCDILPVKRTAGHAWSWFKCYCNAERYYIRPWIKNSPKMTCDCREWWKQTCNPPGRPASRQYEMTAGKSHQIHTCKNDIYRNWLRCWVRVKQLVRTRTDVYRVQVRPVRDWWECLVKVNW